MSDTCHVAIGSGALCGENPTHDLTAMCVHEHLHRAGVCGWHAKVISALDAEGELACNFCRKTGDAGTPLTVQIERRAAA